MRCRSIRKARTKYIVVKEWKGKDRRHVVEWAFDPDDIFLFGQKYLSAMWQYGIAL